MPNNSLAKERRYLISSASGNALVGLVGVTAAMLSSSQAILLDGLFNATYFVADERHQGHARIGSFGHGGGRCYPGAL